MRPRGGDASRRFEQQVNRAMGPVFFCPYRPKAPMAKEVGAVMPAGHRRQPQADSASMPATLYQTQEAEMAVVELASPTEFETAVKDHDFVIVDFWAPWCGPCRSFAPVYDKVSADFEDVVFAKVNTEDQQEIAARFQIRSIPTLMIFREQIIIFSQPGALPESSLRDLLGKAKELDMAEVRRQIAEQQTKTA
jgi:thioredoxin 1